MESPLNISGPQIQTIRRQKGLDHGQLAALCQEQDVALTEIDIQNIELQQREVNDAELICIAKVLDVTGETLMFPAGQTAPWIKQKES